MSAGMPSQYFIVIPVETVSTGWPLARALPGTYIRARLENSAVELQRPAKSSKTEKKDFPTDFSLQDRLY
jgi:hypothetical protein